MIVVVRVGVATTTGASTRADTSLESSVTPDVRNGIIVLI